MAAAADRVALLHDSSDDEMEDGTNANQETSGDAQMLNLNDDQSPAESCSSAGTNSRGNLTVEGSRAKESESICFHKDQKTWDLWILLVHFAIVLNCVGIGLLVRYDKNKSTGLCLLAASFDRGGIVHFSRLVYWCDIILYNIMISASVALSCITSKWIGQLFSHVKWLKIELISVGINFGISAICLVVYSYKLGHWCSQLHLGRQPDVYNPYEAHNATYTCGTHELKPEFLPRCQCDARYMDTVYKPAGDIKLETAYVYASIELACSYLLLALWVITIFLMWKRYKMAYNARQEWIRSVEEACRRRAQTESFANVDNGSNATSSETAEA